MIYESIEVYGVSLFLKIGKHAIAVGRRGAAFPKACVE